MLRIRLIAEICSRRRWLVVRQFCVGRIYQGHDPMPLIHSLQQIANRECKSQHERSVHEKLFHVQSFRLARLKVGHWTKAWKPVRAFSEVHRPYLLSVAANTATNRKGGPFASDLLLIDFNLVGDAAKAETSLGRFQKFAHAPNVIRDLRSIAGVTRNDL